MKILVTGGAGFIGSHLVSRLLGRGDDVTVVDRYSDYYSSELKRRRFAELTRGEAPLVVHDLSNWPLPKLVTQHYDVVVHLAAQPGVRLPLDQAERYVSDNVAAFVNVLKAVKEIQPAKFLYASSSSVYGNDSTSPFRETEKNLTPLSIYGATKLHNEHLANVLARDFAGSVSGLRFFSVYGEWGRPDMAYWKIARAIRLGIPFTLFGDGSVKRDFTYIDDVISGIVGLVGTAAETRLPALLNIGGSRERSMLDVISIMESIMGRPLQVIRLEGLKEDARTTVADPSLLRQVLNDTPEILLEDGLERFCAWYALQADVHSDLWERDAL